MNDREDAMPHIKTLRCPAGVGLLDFLSRSGIELPSFCDGNGVCGRCRIKVTEGTLPVTSSDASFLSPELLQQGWRLACCAVPTEPVTVEVEFPETADVTHVQKAAPHQYGAVVSKRSIALLDLTAPTVVSTAACAGTHREALDDLLSKYPDVRNSLRLIVTTAPSDIDCPGAAVVISRSGDAANDEIAFESAIMEAFRISRQSDEGFGR